MSDDLTKTITELGLDSVCEEPSYIPDFPLSELVEIRPRYPLNECENTIEFNLCGLNDSFYTIPSNIRICGVVEVRKENGNQVTNTDNISCVNLFPHCLWESITTFINDKQVSDTGN